MQDLLEHLHQQHRASEPAPVPPLLRRIRWDRLGWSFLTVLIGLVFLAEIVLRISGQAPAVPSPTNQKDFLTGLTLRLAENLQSPAVLEFEPELLWDWKWGADLDGCPVLSGGYLGTAPSQPPIPGAVRLLVVGDGLGTGTTRPWPSVLARLARLASEGPHLDVANASVPGYSTTQILRRVSREMRIHPDVVIISLPRTDSDPAFGVPDQLLGWRGWAGLAEVFGPGRLAVYRWWKDGPSRAGGQRMTRVPASVAFLQWKRCIQSLVRRGTAVLLVFPPNGKSAEPWEKMLREVRQHQPDARVDILNLQEDFLRRERALLLTVDGGYLTPPGHNLVGRLVMGRLHHLGLLSEVEFHSAVAAAWYDSSAPDRPRAEWTVTPIHHNAEPGTTWTASVRVRNTGNTRFLSRNLLPVFRGQERVDVGGVELIARHVTQGAPDQPPMEPQPLHRDLHPAEETRWEVLLVAPEKPGDYAIELALHARRVGYLEQFGCASTTITLSVR